MWLSSLLPYFALQFDKKPSSYPELCGGGVDVVYNSNCGSTNAAILVETLGGSVSGIKHVGIQRGKEKRAICRTFKCACLSINADKVRSSFSSDTDQIQRKG